MPKAKRESRDFEGKAEESRSFFFGDGFRIFGGRSLAVPTSNPVIYMGIYPDEGAFSKESIVSKLRFDT